jgi:putative ABC transport system substrate-binding protein
VPGVDLGLEKPMKRRDFITLIGGATVVWPLVARAQQGQGTRRIGLLQGLAADDPVAQENNAAFVQGLRQLGWADGRNVHIDFRFGAGNAAVIRKYAAELVGLAPDVILGVAATAGPLLEATHTVPIVFVIVPDPVGAGFVESLSRPGGNATGFLMFEYSLCGKWLELLKEIAPNVTRVAVLRDSTDPSGVGQFSVIQSVAPAVGVDVSPINLRDAAEIERAVTAFAQVANGGLIVTFSALSAVHRDLIITLAARHKLPAVYFLRFFVDAGGLIMYGPNTLDQFRRAAGYVDRIFKGEKPADLPVQAPTKYELVINLKTAKALGLTIPSSVLSRADEVIE